MENRFLEKIQKVEIFHKDKNGNLVKGVAFDLDFPIDFELIFQVHFLNIKPDAAYFLVISYMTNHNQKQLHVLDQNQLLVTIPESDMIKVKDGYGLGSGSFSTSLTILDEGEVLFDISLYDTDWINEENPVPLSTHTDYLVFGEINHE